MTDVGGRTTPSQLSAETEGGSGHGHDGAGRRHEDWEGGDGWIKLLSKKLVKLSLRFR